MGIIQWFSYNMGINSGIIQWTPRSPILNVGIIIVLIPSPKSPVSPSVRLSYQQVSISLLSFSIRGQTD